jgi:hypothetical protein
MYIYIYYAGCYKKSFTIFTGDMHNVLNCHNVAKHCETDEEQKVKSMLIISSTSGGVVNKKFVLAEV